MPIKAEPKPSLDGWVLCFFLARLDFVFEVMNEVMNEVINEVMIGGHFNLQNETIFKTKYSQNYPIYLIFQAKTSIIGWLNIANLKKMSRQK